MLKEYSPSPVKSFAFCLFLLYFFPVLKYCSESPWQNSPLNPAGCPFLVLLQCGLPRAGLGTCFSVWWSLLWVYGEVRETRAGFITISGLLQGVMYGFIFRTVLWNHIYKLWSADGKVQGICLKENALHLNCLFWLLITCDFVLISVSSGHVL